MTGGAKSTLRFVRKVPVDILHRYAIIGIEKVLVQQWSAFLLSNHLAKVNDRLGLEAVGGRFFHYNQKPPCRVLW